MCVREGENKNLNLQLFMILMGFTLSGKNPFDQCHKKSFS